MALFERLLLRKRKMDSYTCKVCNVYVSGYSNYQAHLKGKNHAKKRRQEMSTSSLDEEQTRDDPLPWLFNLKSSSSGGLSRTFHCSVCDVSVSGESNYQQHLKSHEKKKSQANRLRHIITSARNGRDEETSSDSSLESSSEVETSSITTEMSEESSSASYQTDTSCVSEIDDTYGKDMSFCNLCQAPFTGIAAAQQHYASMKHKKRAETARSASKGRSGLLAKTFCEVCNITCCTGADLALHKQSPRHLAKIKVGKHRRQVCHVEDGAVDTDDDDESDCASQSTISSDDLYQKDEKYCPLCKVSFTGPQPAAQHYSGAKHLKKAAVVKSAAKNRISSCVYCSDCHIYCNTVEQLRIHKQSPRHMSKVESKIEDDDSDSDELKINDIKFEYFPNCCTLCKIDTFTSLSHKIDHFTGQKHQQNEKRQSIAKESKPEDFCHACNVLLTTPSQAYDHLNSPSHKSNVAKTTKAPEKHLPPINIQLVETSQKLTQKTPRSYQTELYRKAIQDDSIIFLPTGTGKTLIAAMVISHVLQQNPKRQIVFLVDRVLLVIQQSNVLKEELAHLKIRGKKVKIAGLCGEKQDVSGRPLHEHHILVTTAAYYLNLLENGTVRWQDLSLVVFDEAHHCTKSHPFSVILKDHYKKDTEPPKLLGLTASPAGQPTVKQTYLMLRKLLVNFGNANLAIVEKNKRDLLKFKTEAAPVIKSVSLDMKESELSEELQIYLLTCYYQLVLSIQDFKATCAIDLDSTTVISSEQLLDLQKNISEMLLPRYEERSSMHLFLCHVLGMAEVLGLLWECGLEFAIEKLTSVIEESADRVEKEMKIQMNPKIIKIMKEYEVGSNEMSEVSQLLRDLKENMDWKNGIALVLVKMRCSAHSLTEFLNNSKLLQRKKTQAVCLVGHGSGGQDGGMSVNKQKSTIAKIWSEDNHRVIVATSVAEEGLDLPECDLVVVMEPPNNVTALVQIRGRARKRGAKFIILCRNDGQREQIELLLRREKNMEDAAEWIISGSEDDEA